MPDRTTKVTLVAQISNYLANMTLAEKATQKLGDSAMASAERQKAASAKAGAALMGIGVVAAAAVAIAVKEFADFDAKMAQLQTLSHANSADMQALTTDALTAGQKIGFTANEVADAEIEMVKAGISVTDIMGGALPGALTLAAAGQIDVADSTEIATIAMTQFGLKGKDIPHVADLLAAGADKALGSVGDLGEALKSGGLVSAQFGISLDDTIGTLSAFANAGLLGETAGTDLRQMLLKLAAPSKESGDAMKQLGISVYDSAGHFVGLDGLAGQLHDKLGNLSEAQRNSTLATIFGSRAIAGANVLYKEGAKGIDDWNKKVNDQGFAAQQAQGKMDNLEGDLKKLGSAFQTSLIEAGSGANGELRSLTQGLTNAVTAVGNLPQPLITTGVVITSVIAGIGLLSGGFFTLVPKIQATRVAMDELNITGKSLARGIGSAGGLALVLASLASGLANTGSSSELTADQLEKVNAAAGHLTAAGLSKMFKTSENSVDGLTNSTRIFKQALDDSFSGDFTKNNSASYKWIDGLSFGMVHLSDGYKTNEAQFKQLGTTLANISSTDFITATNQFAVMAKAAGGTDDSYQELFKAMPDYKAKLEALAAAQGVTLTQQQLQNLAVGKGTLAQTIAYQTAQGLVTKTEDLGAAATDASGQISDLSSQIQDFGKANLDSRSAERDFQAAVDDVSSTLKQQEDQYKSTHKTLKGFTASLDINTESGRANQAAVDNIAKTAFAASAAILTQTGSQEDATKAIADGRSALITQLAQFGITGKAAQSYADNLGLIPGKVTTAVAVSGLDTANSAIKHFITTWNGKTITVDVDGRMRLPNGQIMRAHGGILPGAPSAKDNLLIHAASGEFITNAAATSLPANRAALEYMNAGNDISGWASKSSPTYTPTSVSHYASTKHLEQSISFVNPVTQDPRQSAAEAAQVLAAMAVVL